MFLPREAPVFALHHIPCEEPSTARRTPNRALQARRLWNLRSWLGQLSQPLQRPLRLPTLLRTTHAWPSRARRQGSLCQALLRTAPVLPAVLWLTRSLRRTLRTLWQSLVRPMTAGHNFSRLPSVVLGELMSQVSQMQAMFCSAAHGIHKISAVHSWFVLSAACLCGFVCTPQCRALLISAAIHATTRWHMA